MAQSSSSVKVPTELVAERRAGWITFTHFTMKACVAVAIVLLLMLLVFKVF